MGAPARRPLTCLLSLLALTVSLSVPALASEHGQHQWGPDNPQGNFLGADEHLPCDGELLWIFNPGGNHSVTSATLSIEGHDQTYSDQQPQAANFHFRTPGEGVDTTTEVIVTFEGELGEGQATLTISECAPGEVEEEGSVSVVKQAEAIGDGVIPDEDFEFTLSCAEGDHQIVLAAGEQSDPVTAVGGFTDCTIEETTHHDAEVSWHIDHGDGTTTDGDGTTTDVFDVPEGATVVVTFTNVFEADVLGEVFERDDEDLPVGGAVPDAAPEGDDRDELPFGGPSSDVPLLLLAALLMLLFGVGLLRLSRGRQRIAPHVGPRPPVTTRRLVVPH